MTPVVEKWNVFEAAFQGPSEGNPFVDVTLDVEFSQQNRTVVAPGFYDGEGLYRARFMPDAEGEWTYRTRSNAAALNGLTGAFRCGPPSAGNHGPIRVRNRWHFAYADGTPYFPFGTTCYAWTHQPLDMQRQTLDTMRASGFNKLRMAVFPKHYTFNENEPLHDIYERKKDGALDFDRPNVIAFRHFETQVAALGATWASKRTSSFFILMIGGAIARCPPSKTTDTCAIWSRGSAPIAMCGGRSPTNMTSLSM